MNVRTCFMAVVCAALSTVHAGAQQRARDSATVSGIVVDARTGEPVPAAVVRIPDLHRQEATHDDGRFLLHDVPPGSYALVVQRIGYQAHTRTLVVPAEGLTGLRLAIEPFAIQLEATVVTGTLHERARDDVISPTSTVGGAELDRKLGGTVASTVDNQPGVAVTGIGPATARPVIRGLGGDRILVLEDGVRPGDLSSTSADHAVAIDPLTARQIEVVRGPMSLLYGSSALGGVVNIVREEIPTTYPEDLHGAVNAQASSVNRGGAIGASANGGLGPVAVRLEGSARRSGDVRTPTGPLINTQAATYSGALGLARTGDFGHAGLSYRFYANDYGIPGGFVGGHATGVDITMRRHTVRGETEWHINRKIRTAKLAVAFTDYAHDELEPSGAIGTSFDQNVLGVDGIVRHGQAGPVAEGAAGWRAQYRDIHTGGSLRTPSTHDVSAAGFLVEELALGRLRAQLGARYDVAHYVPEDTTAFITVGGQRVPVRPRTFGSVSASAGLLFEVLAGWRVGVSAARAYRTPDFIELYSNGPHLADNAFVVGDPALGEESGLGVEAFSRLSLPGFRAEVAAFRNQLSGYVFPSSRGRAELGAQGGRPRFQYTNEDARFVGVEGDVEIGIGRAIVLDGTLSYVSATFTSVRDSIPVITLTDTTFVPASPYPPFIPPLHGQAGLRYETPRFFVGGGVRGAARQNRLGDFETPTAGHVTGNAFAGLRVLVGGQLHTITITADNLTNAEYRDHLSRLKDIMPEPGRNLSLTYRMLF